jgi:hypothetical protein
MYALEPRHAQGERRMRNVFYIIGVIVVVIIILRLAGIA